MLRELKSAIYSYQFAFSLLFMLICFLGLSIPEWLISVDWGAEYRQSALQLSIGSIFFGGVMLLLPFCASFPYATRQVDELQTSMMRWKLLRSSTSHYARIKIIATAVSGGLAISLAFLLHSLLWNIIALPCDPIAHPYHEMYFHEECLYYTWYSTLYGLPMYISMAIGMFICGSVWALVALAISVWIPDRLLTITIPTCCYYLLSAGVFEHLFGWKLPHPATLYNDALTVWEAQQSLLEYFILFVISCAIYILGLKRRACHA